MTSKVPYAFVWHEEQEILSKLAAGVPAGGLIVEIGTALGGTARIMWEASRANSVDIVSIDLSASKRASNNLADTKVRLVNEASEKVAAQWPSFDGRPVDLLYIDGDHTLEGIHRDFTSWLPWMKAESTLVCHDYDPPGRGHLAHLGVGLFLDSLTHLNPSMTTRHDFKLLQGRLPKEPLVIPGMQECLEFWRKQAARALEARSILFASSIAAGMSRIRENATGLDSVQVCVCIDYALRMDFECLDIMTHDFHGFRRRVETLAMLEHAYGPARFPERISTLEPDSLEELSGWVAAEQVRLQVLAGIIRTLVHWQP